MSQILNHVVALQREQFPGVPSRIPSLLLFRVQGLGAWGLGVRGLGFRGSGLGGSGFRT